MMKSLQQGIPLLSAVMTVLLVLLMVGCARGIHLDFEEEHQDHWEGDFRWEGRHCDLDDDYEGPPVEILEALERECDDPIYEDEDDECEPDWHDDDDCGDHDEEPVCCPEYDDEEPDCEDDGEGECEDPCGEVTTPPPCTEPGETTKAPPGGGDGSTTCPPSGHKTTTSKPPNGGGGGGSDIGAIIGGTIGGAAGLAAIGAAAAGAGVALWRFFQRRAVPTEAATALEGTEMSTMNENALFQSGTDMHSNELFQSAAVAPSDAV